MPNVVSLYDSASHVVSNFLRVVIDTESFGRTFGFPLSVAFGHLDLGLQNFALNLSLHALLKPVLDLLNDNLSVFDLLL